MSFVLVERNEMRCENLFSMTRRTFFSCLVSLSGRLEARLIPTSVPNQNLANVRKETGVLKIITDQQKTNLKKLYFKIELSLLLLFSMHHCTQTKITTFNSQMQTLSKIYFTQNIYFVLYWNIFSGPKSILQYIFLGGQK